MEQQKDNTQENDNTIKTSIMTQEENKPFSKITQTKRGLFIEHLNICPYCNTEILPLDDYHINKECINKICNSENVNDLIRDSIKESENETIKEEIEQANDNINLLFLSKPKSKKAQSEINKLIEGLK
jgi:hypothetical protein